MKKFVAGLGIGAFLGYCASKYQEPAKEKVTGFLKKIGVLGEEKPEEPDTEKPAEEKPAESSEEKKEDKK